MSVVLLLCPRSQRFGEKREQPSTVARRDRHGACGLAWDLLVGLGLVSCLLLFRGRVIQGQADEVIRAAFPCFSRGAYALDGWYGAGTARTVGSGRSLVAAYLLASSSIGSWPWLLLFGACAFWHPSITQGACTMALYTVHST
jgi:hypothetical protein